MKTLKVTLEVAGEGIRSFWTTLADERQITQLENELNEIITSDEYWNETVAKRELNK